MHANQRRKSGEPYFFHPLAVAESLAEWRLDAVSVACGLLHDTVEDTLMTQEEVRAQFGEEVAEIVDGLTKMSKLDFTDRTLLNAENVRKLLVAMGKDVRVLLVKLADRLHNMRTLASMREEKRRRIAHETMELYAPLANRLGMGSVRAELEDLAFANLEPERFAEMRRIIDLKRKRSAPLVEEIKKTLQSALRAQGIEAGIYFRVKHLYGIWKKMGIQEKSLEDIHDWLAYRIICPDRASCYTALGLVHALYKPIPGRFKDYISLPKDNGYQSIHTSVLMPSGDSFEVQFRTREMNEHAEAGIAAHWTYKDGRIANKQEINQTSFLRRMVELHQEARDSRELVANLKGELSFQRIQVFTPQGRPALPAGERHAHRLRLLHPHRGGPPLRGGQGQRAHGAAAAHPEERRPGGGVHPGRPQAQPGLALHRHLGRRQDQDPAVHPRGGAGPRHRLRQGAAGAGGPRPWASAWTPRRCTRPWRPGSRSSSCPTWDAFYASVGFNRTSPRRLLDPLIPETPKTREEKAPAVGPTRSWWTTAWASSTCWPAAASPSGATRSSATPPGAGASPSTGPTART